MFLNSRFDFSLLGSIISVLSFLCGWSERVLKLGKCDDRNRIVPMILCFD